MAGNVGFHTNDVHTVQLFDFGLCRELNPDTNKVKEDAVMTLFGALSWKYTAVECFPQPIVQTPADILAQSTRFLHHPSSRSFGLESLSGSWRGTKARRETGTQYSLEEIERELRVVQEQYQEEVATDSAHLAVAAAAAAAAPSANNGDGTRKTMTTPEYDLKADVYSFAMVYYVSKFKRFRS